MRVLTLILLGSALLLAGMTSASVVGTDSQLKACGTMAGPGWEDPAFGKSGNTGVPFVLTVPSRRSDDERWRRGGLALRASAHALDNAPRRARCVDGS